MLKKHLLQNIKPYNELFFINCLYNALFPVLNYYNLEIIDVLANYVNIYTINKENGYWRSEYLFKNDIAFQLEGMGIEAISNNDMFLLIDNIKQSLVKNEPVVVWLDAYYQPIMIDAFNKKNLLHSVLIYGFDENKECFNIIEHDHIDSLNYDYYKITYSDLLIACQGYLRKFSMDAKYPVFNSYSFNQENYIKKHKKSRYSTIYKTNLLMFKNEIKNGLNDIRIFSDYIIKFSSIENINFDMFLLRLNEIINAKYVQKYTNNIVFYDNEKSSNIINRIIEHLNSFRAIVVKYMLSGSSKIDLLNELPNKVNQLYLLEKEYFDLIFDEAEKERGDK